MVKNTMSSWSLRLKHQSLNPCCSGRWSRTDSYGISTDVICVVLILVVVDDGLVPMFKLCKCSFTMS